MKTNVYKASLTRIAYCFNEFDNVLVSFSGGKDSGVLLNLCYQYAKQNDLLHKLAVYHLDYEAQYQFTTDYVTRTFEKLSDIKRYWLCLPVAANCGCRIDAGTWTPWKKSDKAIWCRKMPKTDYVIHENNCPFEIEENEQDYAVQDKFCLWFSETYGKTAVMIGIRTDESLDRYKLITMQGWIAGNKVYPIYDWKSEDIWIANGKFEWDYNRIYDLYYKAGLTIDQMRVANPFHTCGMNHLKLYRVIEPNTWDKLLNRVNGVNFGRIYGGTTALGFKSLVKPKHFTWEQYAKFLIETNSTEAKENYRKRIEEFISKWTKRGYSKGIPDEADYFMEKKKGIPSYRRIVKTLLKNDYQCKDLN